MGHRLQLSKFRKLKTNSILILSLILLSLAFFVRVSNLERKFYWIDEVSSAFVITGHWPEYIEKETEKYAGQIISIGQYQQILEQKPNSDTGQLISVLLKRDPQHSPLYFMLAQKWATVFGAHPKSLRLVSAILSFIGIPIFAWLCVELFGSVYFGLIGLSIIALSPFHIIFSQQNREYGLWFTVCALSTALLLLANRKNTKYHWIAYGFSVAISLYTFLFSFPFLLSHFLFQWFERKTDYELRFKKFLLCFIVGIFAYLPWLINIMLNVQQVLSLNNWSSKYLEPLIYIQSMVLNFSRLFFDVDLPSFQSLPWDKAGILIPILTSFTIIVISILISIKKLLTSKRILLLSIFAIPLLFLLSMDILAGQGIHALVSRQLMPTWMSVYLAVTFAIGLGLRSTSDVNKGFAISGLVLVLAFEVASMMAYLPQKHWWPLKPKVLFDEAITIELSSPDLLVTSEFDTKQFLSLSYSINSALSLLILNDNQFIPNLDKINKVTLYHPSPSLLNEFKVFFILEETTNAIWIGRRK